jgi:ketosteroid isomerase-like protein
VTPPEDIEIVRDQFAAVNDRDFARAMAHYGEDVTLFASERSGLKAGTYSGKEAVGEWFGDWFRAFGADYRFEITETRELPGGLIYVYARHGGRGRTSGVEVGGENAYLYRVHDGKVVQVGFYASREEALEATALPEWSEGEVE